MIAPINGVRLDDFTSGKSAVRGLPHSKHKQGPADGPRPTHRPKRVEGGQAAAGASRSRLPAFCALASLPSVRGCPLDAAHRLGLAGEG